MYNYQFKCGSFFFRLIAKDDEDAVKKAKQMLEESFPEDAVDYLEINLTNGGFCGRLYVATEGICPKNINSKEPIPDLDPSVPF